MREMLSSDAERSSFGNEMLYFVVERKHFTGVMLHFTHVMLHYGLVMLHFGHVMLSFGRVMLHFGRVMLHYGHGMLHSRHGMLHSAGEIKHSVCEQLLPGNERHHPGAVLRLPWCGVFLPWGAGGLRAERYEAGQGVEVAGCDGNLQFPLEEVVVELRVAVFGCVQRVEGVRADVNAVGGEIESGERFGQVCGRSCGKQRKVSARGGAQGEGVACHHPIELCVGSGDDGNVGTDLTENDVMHKGFKGRLGELGACDDVAALNVGLHIPQAGLAQRRTQFGHRHPIFAGRHHTAQKNCVLIHDVSGFAQLAIAWMPEAIGAASVYI